MPDRGGLLNAGVVERDGAELAPAEELLARYRRYLLLERELDPTTVVGYVHRVRPFLATRVTVDGLDVVRLAAADVNAFALANCGRRTRQSAKLTVTALRSLLRFPACRGSDWRGVGGGRSVGRALAGVGIAAALGARAGARVV
jgi:hypothetical protein